MLSTIRTTIAMTIRSLAFAALLFPLSVQAQDRVGVMNPQEVIAALPETKAVEDNLQRFVTQRQEEFETKYSAWLEAVTRFQQDIESNTLSAEAQQREQERLAGAQNELQGMEQQFQADLQRRRAELLEPILVRMNEAMEAVARENGIAMVLNQTTAGGDPIVYFASADAKNITQLVIKKLTTP